MTVTINGTTGIAGVDGSAATPAVQGADTNTGVFYPAADTVGIATGGTEQVRVASAGQIGIGGANYGTSGQVLTSGGASAAPSWATVTTAQPINYQIFNASSTWTKPSGYGNGSRVHVQAWGGGQGGARATGGTGGGGGSYVEYWLQLSSFGATETITIGAGGAARTTNGAGNAGGNTTVGSLVTAYGGANGSGGSPLMAGTVNSGSGVTELRPNAIFTIGGTSATTLRASLSSGGVAFNAAGSTPTLSQANASDGVFGGGGGHSSSGNTTQIAGWSIYGGGGGGWGTGGTGGSSIYGGSGGTGGTTGTAGSGVQPSGGGGGTTSSGTSGAGGAGRVILTVYDGVIG